MIAATHRPIAAAGAALLGAGIIAANPAVMTHVPTMPHLDAPEIALQASVLDIFKFPALQQIAANQVEVLAIEAHGLTEAGRGALQSAVQLPGALITATRQTLTGDPLAGLTTLEDWAVSSAKATFVPIISARITVGQIDLAIQSALLPAWPLALVSFAGGLFNGADTITRGVITAGQDLIQAVLSFNLGNIVQAVVGGIQGIVGSVVAGAQTAVDGVVGAQNLLADALAARPGAPSAGAAVPALAKSLRSTPKSAAAVQDSQAGSDATVDAPASKPVRAHLPRAVASQRARHAADSADTAQGDSHDTARTSHTRAGRHAANAN